MKMEVVGKEQSEGRFGLEGSPRFVPSLAHLMGASRACHLPTDVTCPVTAWSRSFTLLLPFFLPHNPCIHWEDPCSSLAMAAIIAAHAVERDETAS